MESEMWKRILCANSNQKRTGVVTLRHKGLSIRKMLQETKKDIIC